MKKVIRNIIFAGLLMSFSFQGYMLSAQKNLQSVLSYALFNSPANGPYIETYLSVRYQGCHFIKEADGKFRANIGVTFIFRQDTLIKKVKKYNLSSQPLDDTIKLPDNFLDVQRFLLPEGNYEMELKLSDNNAPPSSDVQKAQKSLSSRVMIAVSFKNNEISFSDIELVDSFTKSGDENVLSKSGFDIVPHVISFYPKNKDKIIFYAELYNADKVMGSDSKFLFKYFIESDETKLPIDGFVKIKKESSKLVNVLLSEIDIAKLPSGNYYLVIEARDKENKIAATCNLFFQRSNPDLKPQPADFSGVDAENTFVAKITDLKLLDDYINSLYPISSQLDYQFSQDVLKFADIKAKQRYFYSFWLKRKPDAPEKAWLSYLDQVNKVNDAYGCRIIKGYMSDRGRVFLKYGPPNTIYNNESEPSAYPYEIWHYYKLSNQGNVRFVFYSPDLVSNCYELLHSEAIGEVHNQQWQVTLYGRNTIPGNIDLETPTKHWGSEVDDFFRHPR